MMNTMPLPLALPADLARLIQKAAWEQETMGMTDASVYRLFYPDNTRQYLKTVALDAEFPLRPEYERLTWLKGRLPVPQVLYYGSDDVRSFLLMTEIPGLMACDETLFRHLAKDRIVALLAEGMRQLHSVAIADCPFDQRLDGKIAEAEYRLEAGLVNEEDFDPDNEGRSAQSAFEDLLDTRPYDEDLVFTHGDYCLPNIMIDPDRRQVSGFIDLGRAGIADRYQDLALAQRSTIYNLGAAWLPVLWQTYGIEKVDYDRVAFYRLLDEFF